jgi:superfamily II DNA or RNA helicase
MGYNKNENEEHTVLHKLEWGVIAMELRDYQQECVDAVLAAWESGRRRALIAMPTGTGKTVVFSHIIKRRLNQGRALVLVHRDELVQQTLEKLHAIVPEASVGVIKAERDEHNADVVVASIQTLSRQDRLKRIPRSSFQTIIVDEAHHSRAESYMRTLEHFMAFAPDGPCVLGCTATPERHDKLALGKVYQDIVYHASIPSMIRRGYLCDVRGLRVMARVDLSKVRTRGGDYVESELERALISANGVEAICRALLEFASDRKAIIFVPGVEMAHLTAAALREAGVAAAAIDGSMPLTERRELLAKLRSGELQAIANCMVLTEGFDEPSVDCIFVARPTRSRTLYVQMVGRGLRLAEGKQDCLVLDLVGASEDLKLQTLDRITYTDPQKLGGGFLQAERSSNKRLQVEHAIQDLIAMPVALLEQSKFRWLRGSRGYVLVMAGGVIRVEWDENDEMWIGVHTTYLGSTMEIKRANELEDVIDACEDYVKDSGSEILAKANAKWRSQPATKAQLDVLSRWGIELNGSLTRGTASDLIALGKRDARQLAAQIV